MKKALCLLALSVAGCRGCGNTPSEPTIHFVDKNAEAVAEIRDIRVLVRLREGMKNELSAIITANQVASLQEELALTLGFDPSTEAGLTKAGLATQGSISVQIGGGGKSALWAIPIKDSKAFGQTVQNIAAARVGVSKTVVDKTPHGAVTVLQSEFGPDVITVAAYGTKGNVGLVGAGGDAKKMVAEALGRKPIDSIAGHPEYKKQLTGLPGDWELRVISPSGNKAVTSALSLLRGRVSLGALDKHPQLQNLVSAGWSINASKKGVTAQGNVRFNEAGMVLAKKLFEPAGETPAGVRALDIAPATAILQIGGETQTLIDVIAPPGTPNRTALTNMFFRVKQDMNTDVQQEVLPLLSGHGIAVVGLGDLGQIPFRALSRNPMAALWTAFAVGVKDEATIQKIEKRLDPGLEERKFEIASRNAAGKDVRVLKAVDPRSQVSSTLVETFGKHGAMVFSNEPQMTNLIVSNDKGRDLLNGGGGLALDVRFGVIARQLMTFNIQSLPALFRSIARKIIEAVRLLDRLELRVKPAPDGLRMEGRLLLALPQGGA